MLKPYNIYIYTSCILYRYTKNTNKLYKQVAYYIQQIFHKASKTETLDLCQLPRPPNEIHKMINLPASVKIFKNKLKN